jgi:CheY-like chemotaxis protein
MTGPGRRITILVIDPYERDRKQLLACLRDAVGDCACIEAGDGKTGLDLFKTVQPDCVVVELKQEDMIGMEVLGLLKTHMGGTPVPIFIWTRLGGALKEGATMLGIQGYFTKSVGSEAAVARAIADVIG